MSWMNRDAARGTMAMPFVTLLVVAPAIGALVARSPSLGVSVPVALFGILLLTLSLDNPVTIRRAALSVCALVISYPALLPRQQSDRLAPIYGGSFDARAKALLVVVSIVASAGALLWLATPGASAAFTRAPLNRFAVYGVLILFSLIYTPDRSWAAFAAIRLIEYFVVIAVLAALVRTAAQLKRVVDVMVGAIGVVLVVYWVDIVRGSAFQEDGRTSVSWIHANAAAALAGILTTITATRFFTATSSRDSLAMGALSCFGVASAVMLSGKTAVGGTILGLALMMVMVAIRKGTHLKAGRVLVALVAAAVGVSYVISANIGIAASLQAYNENPYAPATTLTGRIPIWSTAINDTLSSPLRMLFGRGYMSTFATGLEGHFWVTHQAHNSFIQTFFDLGSLGLLAVLLIYAGAWRSVLRQVRSFRNTDDRWPLSIELLAALTVLTAMSFTESIFTGVFDPVAMTFVLVVFAIYQNDRIARPASVTISRPPICEVPHGRPKK